MDKSGMVLNFIFTIEEAHTIIELLRSNDNNSLADEIQETIDEEYSPWSFKQMEKYR